MNDEIDELRAEVAAAYVRGLERAIEIIEKWNTGQFSGAGLLETIQTEIEKAKG